MERFRKLIEEAIKDRSSDLFILPYQDKYRLLTCVQGEKRCVTELSAEVGQQMITYFKYRGNMTVSEHRRPQIGALKWHTNNKTTVDLRLSTVGNFRSQESMVIRFIYSLAELEYRLNLPEQWEKITKLTHQRGLILFAGPMGSGKTTTMYQLAKGLASKELVMTIEDPVEIEEANFLQLQVNDKAGMGYQELLKVGLRHRPDDFIIGEIRDNKTANLAVQAALSGHLVLATVHATNAFGVIARMRQLEVEKYYLQQCLTGICYQRLLPLYNGTALLFDLLMGEELLVAVEEGKNRGMSNEWQRQVEKLYRERQLSLANYEKFKNG
ncbi:competence type IV pilus ATPase ComGA [Limosilactobacillus fastidiosus]|uniref:Flp pilus assembly complex ATPase component TadA n=1 Tax=Limosilactobacillus fastidiosus TaxID=2759855 RepID=A0A7W3TY53_9LACO|nr:competence type IV pilus ATPase ComGA [Limosilactobacillus fastidiosus]MBB1062630.1 Flp pilus assembly complex ATPase component TadA [Limosilactobacillus fastidiosus]MBB1085448.1 Flp pilus assembly complex ATPase component TadA [Limosilactobacillus fastidiosus]MCD7083798.1 Flp pilus assembly complex ATPase component TadA [Limosilactobacillus fastidiosus]MCD7085350.1 Flp pilus assembly complex ATPase component TadA [Limosilactobacillus fastidiosus]MCD7114076.1 Flp pilus assembly complex ATPa